MDWIFTTRTSFGFGNPNLAGALFAMLALAVWVLYWPPERGHRGPRPSAAFWFCLVTSGLFVALLVMTASRGAVVSLACGSLAAWLAAGRPWPSTAKTVALALVVAGIVLFAGVGRLGMRVAESSPEEGSIGSRTAIYGAVPAMISAAPGGWGSGRSAAAYENWFQDANDTRNYKHLISTHAIWMVERGWGFRVAYIFGGLAALVLGFYCPVAFGVLVCWGIAGVFSHVGASWPLGIVPGLALGLSVWRRTVTRCWPQPAMGFLLVCGAFFFVSLLAFFGSMTHASGKIFYDGGAVWVGEGADRLWFPAPDKAVMGEDYGKMVRQFSWEAVVGDAEVIREQSPRKIALSGNAGFPSGGVLVPPYDLVWLNPPSKMETAQKTIVEAANRKWIVWGELRTDANPRRLKPWFEALSQASWVAVPGKALLLDNFEISSLFVAP